MAKQDEIKKINSLLSEAIDAGLEAEVVYTALKTMREDETLSPSQAMTIGVEEWVR
jgi:hypothetical protein